MLRSDQNIVIYSLDYDGCSDILFDELFHKYYGAHTHVLSMLRHKLNHFFKKNATLSKNVELYVGSNRQSCELDEKNTHLRKTGSCFANFQKLCEKKEWVFRPLLFADICNQMPSGSAINDEKLQCSYFDPNKTDILKHQLMDVEKNHPDKEVHFFFLDDDADNDILPKLKKYLNKFSMNLSSNIHVHLVKFDWYGEIQEHNETLIETFYIQGKKHKIQEELHESSVIRVNHDNGDMPLSSSKHSFFARGRNWISNVKNKISQKFHQEENRTTLTHNP